MEPELVYDSSEQSPSPRDTISPCPGGSMESLDGVINKHNQEPGQARGGVTTVAVGLICFNLVLDVQYISLTPGGRRTLARGSRPGLGGGHRQTLSLSPVTQHSSAL